MDVKVKIGIGIILVILLFGCVNSNSYSNFVERGKSANYIVYYEETQDPPSISPKINIANYKFGTKTRGDWHYTHNDGEHSIISDGEYSYGCVKPKDGNWVCTSSSVQPAPELEPFVFSGNETILGEDCTCFSYELNESNEYYGMDVKSTVCFTYDGIITKRTASSVTTQPSVCPTGADCGSEEAVTTYSNYSLIATKISRDVDDTYFSLPISEGTQDDLAFTEYVDENIGFSVMRPNEWLPATRYPLVFFAPDGKTYKACGNTHYPQMIFLKKEYSEELDLQAVRDDLSSTGIYDFKFDFVRTVKSSGDIITSEVLVEESTTFLEKEGLLIKAERTGGLCGDMTGLVKMTVDGNTAYALLYRTPPGIFDRYLPYAQKMFDTIQLN